MNFLNIFKSKAKKLERTIGIGLSKDITMTEIIIQVAEKIVNSTNNKIILVGDHDIIEILKNTARKLDSKLLFIVDADPANYLAREIFEQQSFQ